MSTPRLPEIDIDFEIQPFVGSRVWEDWARIFNEASAELASFVPVTAASLEDHRPPDFRPDQVLFARQKKKRVGYVHLRPSRGVAFIEELAVIPEAWGQGVGAALLVAAIELAEARGFPQVALTVDQSNKRARALYARLGFERLGERTHLVRRP